MARGRRYLPEFRQHRRSKGTSGRPRIHAARECTRTRRNPEKVSAEASTLSGFPCYSHSDPKAGLFLASEEPSRVLPLYCRVTPAAVIGKVGPGSPPVKGNRRTVFAARRDFSRSPRHTSRTGRSTRHRRLLIRPGRTERLERAPLAQPSGPGRESVVGHRPFDGGPQRP